MATIFNRQNDEKDQEKQGQTTPQSNINAGGSTPASNLTGNANTSRQGSGRFTNLQSYLKANQGGGQQLASGISNRINKDINPQKTQSEQYNEKVAQGVQQSKDTLGQGQQNLSQLQQIGQNIQGQTGADKYGQQADLGIEAFTQDPNYNRFKDIQAGTAINENELNLNQQILSNAANLYAQKAQGYSDQVGTEGGRFDLLKQTYGGNVNPQYTKGQQRLDQLFLARQGLGDLKSQLSEDVQSAQGLVKGARASGQDINTIEAAERGLIGDINTQSMSNEDAYIKMLESYVPEINRLREEQFQDVNRTIQAVGQGFGPAGSFQKATPNAGNVNYDILRDLGLSGSQQVYNVFNNLQAEDVASRGKQAQDYRDAATETDVNRYNALAQIAGIADPNKRLTQAADLGKAWEARTGDASLQSRIDSAAKSFQNFASGQDYNRAWSGGKKSFANVSGNLANLLAGGNISAHEKRGAAQSSILADQIAKQALQDLASQGYGNVLNVGAGSQQNILPTTAASIYGGGGKTGGSSWIPGAGIGGYIGGGIGAALGGLLGHRSTTYGHQFGTDLNQNLAAALQQAGVGQDIQLSPNEYTKVNKEDIK